MLSRKGNSRTIATTINRRVDECRCLVLRRNILELFICREHVREICGKPLSEHRLTSREAVDVTHWRRRPLRLSAMVHEDHHMREGRIQPEARRKRDGSPAGYRRLVQQARVPEHLC